MPKETLVLKDFTTGLVGSEHGSDMPDNSIVEGANINVNRNLGLVELSGRYKKAQRADVINLDGTAEDFTAMGSTIGFRGRGLFYFNSDYSDMVTENFVGTGGGSQGWDSKFSQHFSGSGVYVGPKSIRDSNTEYFVYASRHHNRTGLSATPGFTSAVFHLYAVDNATRINLLGENLGYAFDGIYNKHISDFPMGNYGSSNYHNGSDPNYAENWFPVYFYANGAVRICDGGFLEQNTAKVYLGYERDNVLFNGLTASADNTAIDTSPFRIDNWIFDKGGNTDATEGMLYAPVTKIIYKDNGGGVDEAALSSVGVENKVALILSKRNGITLAGSGQTYPGIDYQFNENSFTNQGGLIVDIPDDGAIACSLHVRTDGAQGEILSDANILLPQMQINEEGWGLYASYVYENNQESSLTKFDSLNAINTESIYDGPNNLIFGNNLRIDVAWQVNANKKKVHPRVKGVKLYIKTSEEQDLSKGGGLSSDYHLISEMNFELGARSPASPSYSEWYPARYINNSTSFVCRNSFGTFSETFQTLHGYTPDDIKPCYYKTACVLHGKAYVGNVKFNGRLYPDRMMKSEVGEFDTFTRYGFVTISGTEDDGDSIVHLEGFGDRVLQFKNNIVYIINVSKQYDYVELSVKHAGISNPSQVVQTDKGVYWANRRGLWWYNGENVINLLQNRGLIVNNKSLRYNVESDTSITEGEFENTISSWENIFLDNKDGAPVLSYDPINKDVIIMSQLKYEESRINVGDNAKDNNYLYDSQGDWTAYGVGTSVSHNASENRLEVTTNSESNIDQGVNLASNKLGGMVAGETYRVEADLQTISGYDSGSPIIRFSLCGQEANIEATDGNPALGEAITSSSQRYFADITITNPSSALIIFNDAGRTADDIGVFAVKNVSVRPVPTPQDDVAFMWNTDKNNLTQLFGRTSRYGKSNSIITFKGESAFLELGKNYYNEGQAPSNENFALEISPKLKVFHTSAQSDNVPGDSDKRNLFLLSKAIDFGNHSRRKVIQSVHFTYKAGGSMYFVPFIKAYYLDGTSPSIYYMCQSNASGVTAANLDDSNFNGILPATSDKFETYKYRHVLASGVSGDAVSMRSKVKNVGAIQIGLAKLHTDNTINPSFALEEIAVTFRNKSAK